LDSDSSFNAISSDLNTSSLSKYPPAFVGNRNLKPQQSSSLGQVTKSKSSALGGGQERGLRPGTLPVPLIVGLGLAAELSLKNHSKREKACRAFRDRALKGLAQLSPVINGEQSRALPHVLNLSFPDLDSEAVMVALKDLIAISNDSGVSSPQLAAALYFVNESLHSQRP
jgi:cysteine sulfinate desulfinase/cysteine desulfurase-like protein